MDKYEIIADKIRSADGVLIGASNGLSIAEGYNIFADEKRYSENFSDFQNKYGFKNLIHGAFSEFRSEGEKWSYFSRMAYYYSFNTEPSKLMKSLYELVAEKQYFVVTSNTDDHFAKAGFSRERLFEIEGNMRKMQCEKGCSNATYLSRKSIYNMIEHQNGMEIPDKYLPKCPVCGGDMQLNVAVNQFFVKDAEWIERYNGFMEFLKTYREKHLLILELGVGARNQMIKAPFMDIAYAQPHTFYITFNKSEIYIPDCIAEKSMGVDGDLSVIIPEILEIYKGNKTY